MTIHRDIDADAVSVEDRTEIDGYDGTELRRDGTEVIDRRPVYETAPAEAAAPSSQWLDRVRWGPVWAGLVTTLATFLLLTVAAVSVGAGALTAGADTATAGLGGA